MLAYFFHVTLSANQNTYSYRMSGGGGISVLYNKKIERDDITDILSKSTKKTSSENVTSQF